MGELVEHQDVLRTDDARQHTHVGERNRWEDDCRLSAHPAGDLVFEFDFRAATSEGPRRAELGAPLLGPPSESRPNARVLIQTQETVEAEINEALAVNQHFAVWPDLLDVELLKMNFGILLGRPGKKPHQIGRCDRMGKLIQREASYIRVHESFLSFKMGRDFRSRESVGDAGTNHDSFCDAEITVQTAKADVAVEYGAAFPKKVPPSTLKVKSFEKTVIA